jgi:hypothetical protein
MEAAITKVFATPPAYRYITNSSFDDKTTRCIIKEMILAANGGEKFLDDNGKLLRLVWDNISGYQWPVEIHTREENTEYGLVRTVLLCSLSEEKSESSLVYHGGDEAFYQAVQTAFEIPFV